MDDKGKSLRWWADERIPGVRVVVVGDGKQRAATEELLIGAALPERERTTRALAARPWSKVVRRGGSSGGKAVEGRIRWWPGLGPKWLRWGGCGGALQWSVWFTVGRVSHEGK